MRFSTCFSDFHLMKSKNTLFVLFFLCRYTFSSQTSHKKTLMLCVFHFVAEKTRITTINRYTFVERAQKSWVLSDLYQIFSFFSKTIRSDQISKKLKTGFYLIWSGQIRIWPQMLSDAHPCLDGNHGLDLIHPHSDALADNNKISKIAKKCNFEPKRAFLTPKNGPKSP